MRNVLIVFCLVCISSDVFANGPFDYDNLAFFVYGPTKSAAVAKIATIEHPTTHRFGKFEKYDMSSPWVELSPKAAADLGLLLERRLEEEARVYDRGADVLIRMPLCFDPGYAIRLTTDRGDRDFVICLTCEYVFVFDTLGHRLGLNPEGKFLNALSASYRDEFGVVAGPPKNPNQSSEPTPASGTATAGQEPRLP